MNDIAAAAGLTGSAVSKMLPRLGYCAGRMARWRPSMATEAITIDLTPDEALVLFDFLSRYSDSDRLETVDQAEQRVLWDVCASLERALVAPFDPNYGELLAAARERVRDPA